jgi:hypothetical protein
MADNLYTILEFSRAVGKSRQGIFKNVKKGLIPAAEKDGKFIIDINHHHVRAYIESLDTPFTPKPAKKQVKKAKKKKVTAKKKVKKTVKKKAASKKPAKKPVKKAAKKPPKKPHEYTENDIPDYVKDIADSGALTIEQALSLPKTVVEKIKIYEQIKELKDKRAKARREVMPVKSVRATMNKIYEIHVSQLHQIKSRVIPDIAGIMKCTDDELKLKSEERLNDEIYDVLKNIKYEIDEFINAYADTN